MGKGNKSAHAQFRRYSLVTRITRFATTPATSRCFLHSVCPTDETRLRTKLGSFSTAFRTSSIDSATVAGTYDPQYSSHLWGACSSLGSMTATIPVLGVEKGSIVTRLYPKSPWVSCLSVRDDNLSLDFSWVSGATGSAPRYTN